MSPLVEMGRVPWGDVRSGVRWRRGRRFRGLDQYDGANTTSRRQGMMKYFRFHGVARDVATKRPDVVEEVCLKAHSEQRLDVPQATFDWMVDKALWRYAFRKFALRRRPAWPWQDVLPGLQRVKFPKCSQYREYLRDHPLPAHTPAPAPAPIDGHLLSSGDTEDAPVARRGRPAPKAASI